MVGSMTYLLCCCYVCLFLSQRHCLLAGDVRVRESVRSGTPGQAPTVTTSRFGCLAANAATVDQKRQLQGPYVEDAKQDDGGSRFNSVSFSISSL